MTATGQVSSPPPGRNQWPLTSERRVPRPGESHQLIRCPQQQPCEKLLTAQCREMITNGLARVESGATETLTSMRSELQLDVTSTAPSGPPERSRGTSAFAIPNLQFLSQAMQLQSPDKMPHPQHEISRRGPQTRRPLPP